MPNEIANYRYDPFEETLTVAAISDEAHIIPVNAPFVVYLAEVPQKETPSTVSIPGFSEVEANPTPGEFRVDYSYGTGAILFNAADAGKQISVTYNGKGTAAVHSIFNAIAANDPDVSSYNEWWLFEEWGDHFHFQEKLTSWKSASVGFSVTGSDGILRVTNTGSTSGLVANHRFNPGYGFNMVAKFKLDQSATAIAADDFRIGVASSFVSNVSPVGLSFALKRASTVNSPTDMEFLWVDTAGSTLAVTIDASYTAYTAFTIDYTPGWLTVEADGATVIDTSTWISTTVYGWGFMAVVGPTTPPFNLNMDYIGFVPTSSLAMGV